VPNTLCHIGFQGPLNRYANGQIDLRLVIIGCIIPDLPWIMLAVLIRSGLFNPYDLRLYCTAQASLVFCTFLSLALASFATRFYRTAIILFANCFLHLLLDSLQIKWGNGVNLLAPFDWQFLHFDLSWPEHPLTVGCTILGGLYLLFHYRSIVARPLVFAPLTRKRFLTALILTGLYLLGPVAVMPQLERADTYYLHTMRQVDQRGGKSVEFDRVHYNAETQEFKTFTGEPIALTGAVPQQSGRVSFRGRFLTPTIFFAKEFHLHKDFRDIASYLGLLMACALLTHSLLLTLVPSLKSTKEK